ncbi:bis-aminopropyl spermidine synthase family protein [Streptomyces alkaliterrae]|uniref:Bis-aminopropyl spermidine synthase family protein n=1 Tax=Streptomyces alkaliterrae TaxID=2213162 RepID=A0A5P0YRN7_9ACTN|nr:bis-aminopropyl spermidine synthase family protein [Streptomyces alkaliterrae]MBB1261095.1 bis-aminopropyl spermidine synthase family protein [Streptomyces alkaliterrae]MQS02991.1 putative methyltransferase [Streptomyces alkaliterrae]
MTAAESSQLTDQPPIERVADLVAGYGAHARPLRELLATLDGTPHDLASLVRATALPRRTVEEMLSALGSDLTENADGGHALRPERADAYRERFRLGQLAATALTDPFAARLAEQAPLVERMAGLIRGAPGSDRDLDHVSATAETVVRRALWLDATFDLAGARLLCVGDHDLTSLATACLRPELAVTVVDIDERVLEFVDTAADGLDLDVRCLHTDLRLGLPPTVAGTADLVVTDPPYTPDGLRLFLARGAEGLRDREHGRLVMAYGFSSRQPALGLKSQQAVQGLHLAYEAIWPHFNRYHGAQAVGSAADWYVCRPTARTWRTLDHAVRDAAGNIYTHGARSMEAAGATELDEDAARRVLDTAAHPVSALVGPGWPDGAGDVKGRLGVGTLLAGGLPPAHTRRGRFAVAVNLAEDPGSWLPRVLLSTNAAQVVVVVPNNHPDIADESSQQALHALLAAKYRLRFRRNLPDRGHALVEATALPAGADDSGGPADPAEWLAHWLLHRAHGKLGNVWRDGLIRLADVTGAPRPTKNQAREAVRGAVGRPALLDARLVDLPRHRLHTLLAELAPATVETVARP